MSLRALALDWSLDGSIGPAFAVLLAAAGYVYLLAAKLGTKRDRRRRPWPRGRSFCFLTGLAVLFVDLYSGIGTEADTRLLVHMIEHTVMWVVVAPLLAAGAPVRLAFFALPRAKRRPLARWLHARPVSALTGSVGSVSLFSAVLVFSHLPAVYGLALGNDYVHEVEHGLYLLTALLVWAPLLGADPLPHRPGPRGQLACMLVCMMPMVLIAVGWEPRRTPSMVTTSTSSVPPRFTTNASQRRSCGPDAYRRSPCQPLRGFERPSQPRCLQQMPSQRAPA